MSDSNRKNKRRPNNAGDAQPLFQVHEHRPPSRLPMQRGDDEFDDPPELRPRTAQRPPVAVSERTRRVPMILREEDLDDLEPPAVAPLSKAAAHVQQATLMYEPAFERGPPIHYPAEQRSVFQFVQDHPWMLLPICGVCILIILWASGPAETTFSNYSNYGRSPAPVSPMAGDAEPAVKLPTLAGEHSVIGAPTVTAAQIDAVLAEYGSPAAGTGKIWVEKGKKYGIDPAYALAFFIHESSAGTNPGWAGMKPNGSTTHNIGNIICAGYDTCYGRFRDYPGWDNGIEDWYKLISVEYVGDRGVHTVEQIIPIYAPSFENNVPAYVDAVQSMINQWRSKGGGS